LRESEWKENKEKAKEWQGRSNAANCTGTARVWALGLRGKVLLGCSGGARGDRRGSSAVSAYTAYVKFVSPTSTGTPISVVCLPTDLTVARSDLSSPSCRPMATWWAGNDASVRAAPVFKGIGEGIDIRV